MCVYLYCVCVCVVYIPPNGMPRRKGGTNRGKEKRKREREKQEEKAREIFVERETTGLTSGAPACPTRGQQGFYIGKDLPLESDKVKAHPELLGQNMFPASLADGDFRLPTEGYYAAVLDLSMRVLEILAKGLPYGDDIFHEFVSNDPVCIMRLLHYPPQQASPPRDQRQLGAGAHTDFGTSSLSALLVLLLPPPMVL